MLQRQQRQQQRLKHLQREQQQQEQLRHHVTFAAQTGKLEQLISALEGAALIACANAGDQSSYAEADFNQADTSGMAVAGFRA